MIRNTNFDETAKPLPFAKPLLQDGFFDYELDNELWIDILGFDGIYQVSNLGRIKSLKRYVEHPRHGSLLIKERIKKFGVDKKRGYNITLSYGGINKTRLAHKIVAESFIKNPFNFNCVRHIDGNKKNNRVENLEWFTLIDSSIIANKKIKKTSNNNGVYYDKSKDRWRATFNKKSLGTFKTEIEAVKEREKYCYENGIRFLYDSQTIL
jgi:hypothetical protein